MAKTMRYAVMIKCYDHPVKVVSEHYSSIAAGRMLGSYISGKRRPSGLEWAFVRDRYCPGDDNPWSSATITRNQLLKLQ